MNNDHTYIGADVLDSRDIEERISDLKAMIETDPHDEDAREELEGWLELKGQLDHSPNWEHGMQVIHDNYFEDFAQQLAEDIGAIDREAGWPACHIDWEAAAESLRMDYTHAKVRGHEYWAR